jgi:hypothetical protein
MHHFPIEEFFCKTCCIVLHCHPSHATRLVLLALRHGEDDLPIGPARLAVRVREPSGNR